MSTDEFIENTLQTHMENTALPFVIQPKHFENVCKVTPVLLQGMTHFITITIKPKLYKYTSHTQFDLTWVHVHCVLMRAYESIFVAEHTKQGNIHYHAMFKGDNMAFMSIINGLKKDRMLGHIHVSPPFDGGLACKARAYIYMCKDVNDTMKQLGKTRNPVFYSDIGV
jgi:hypothetical protein